MTDELLSFQYPGSHFEYDIQKIKLVIKVDREYLRWQFSNLFFSQTINDITTKFGPYMERFYLERTTA